MLLRAPKALSPIRISAANLKELAALK